ncbi:MAG TPA: UPF0758 domain-containing protein [Candidatus Saccharimonadaceae bacterium]|nr:UPF0758 domain-containing protein [Candidatus Saccharimonadaceae bacterium]
MTRNSTLLRPREKIARKAVHALSAHELLQVVIGVGTRSQPVERIARAVLKVLRHHRRPPSFATLLMIEGLGVAQAARISASFELAERVRAGLVQRKEPPLVYQLPLRYSAKSAGGETLRESVIESATPSAVEAVTRQLIERLLEVHASGVSIVLEGSAQYSRPDMRTLSLARQIRAGCDLMGIMITSFSIEAGGKREQIV